MTHRPFPRARLKKTNMPLYFRIILGCLAIAGAGFTIRALWTGIVYGKGWTPYSRDEQPGMFATLVFGNLVGIAVCLWLAAGYTMEDFLAPFGLGALSR
jgi:hypothetical protein